jgi:5S rRNA maturation endonuclease (ribonuclease M5)
MDESIISRLKAELPTIESHLQHTIAGCGDKVKAPCPVCGGKDRFYVRKDGSYGCRQCGASGRDNVDFFRWIDGLDFKGLARKYLDGNGSPPSKNRLKARAVRENLTKTYSYRDEDGAELFQVFRFEEEKREKTFRQGINGDWKAGIKGIRRVLYRLPEIANAREIVLVEGEKDADSLATLGLTATTSPMGADNWKGQYAEFLRGKQIVIIPDNDTPGEKYLNAVLPTLHGVAESVKIVRLPAANDVTDFISKFEEPEEAAERLAVMIESAEEYRPPEAVATAQKLIYMPNWDNCPPEVEVLATLGGIPVLHRQNICMITAGAGYGKTAAIHAALCTLVNPGNETLGLSVFGGGATLLDTEHDERLFNILWQRFMYRSGLLRPTPCPENIQWKSLRAVDKLAERKKYLMAELSESGGLLVVDGIGDFVSDPNNSDECTELVYELLSKAQVNDCGILLSLHNNPLTGKEKARGVLGSELWRKAESAIIINRKDDGICQITTGYSLGKNRANDDQLSAYFCWSEEHRMHMPCEPPEGTKGKTKKQQQQIIAALQGEYTYTDLIELIMQVADVKDSMARKKIKTLVDQGLIEKTDGGFYRERTIGHWADNI